MYDNTDFFRQAQLPQGRKTILLLRGKNDFLYLKTVKPSNELLTLAWRFLFLLDCL